MLSRTIPFSFENKLSKFVVLSLLLSLYLCGNTDQFTTEFPLQCLLHPEHWNLDFTHIPPSHEVASLSVFLLSQLSKPVGPFPPSASCVFSFIILGCHITCAYHLSSRFFHKVKSRPRCALQVSPEINYIVSFAALF